MRNIDPSLYFLNVEECYDLMFELNNCYLENPFLKHFGKCGSLDAKLGRCLMKQRELRQMKNMRESRIANKERLDRLKELQKETDIM